MRALAFLILLAAPDDLQIEALKEGPPQDVSEAIRKELAGEGARVTRNKAAFADVWMAKSLPKVEPSPEEGVKYPLLQPGCLIGALKFHSDWSDFRGQPIKAGIYTLRYSCQPVDGDHTGTADTRDFLVLSPAAADQVPAATGWKDLMNLSRKASGTKHPAVMYLVSRGPSEGALPRVLKDGDAERWLLECELPVGDKKARLIAVVVGRAPE